MKPPLSYVPLLPVLGALVAGILFCLIPGGGWVGLTLWVIAVALLIWRKTELSIIAVGVAIGWTAMFMSISHAGDNRVLDKDGRAPIYGLVSCVVEIPSGQRVELEVDHEKITLYVGSLFPQIKQGDLVSAYAFFFEQDNQPDPIIDDGRLTITDKITQRPTAFVGRDDIEIVGHKSTLRLKLIILRDKLVDRLYTGSLTPETADLLAAVMLGDSTMIDSERRQSFSASGLAHLLALSGAHVAVVILILSLFLTPLKLLRHDTSAYVIMVIILWIYAIMTGLSHSVVRAVIMATFVAGAYIFNRRSSSFNSLLASAILILIFDPEALFEISFQLSFLAVGSILLLLNGIVALSNGKRLLAILLKYLAMPIVAMASTWALSAYYFGTFPCLFIVASVPASIIMTLMLGLGGVYLVGAVIGLDFGVVSFLLNQLDRLLSWIIDLTTAPTWSVINNIYLPPLAVLLFTIVPVLIAGWMWRRRVVWAYATTAVIISGIAVTKLSIDRRGCQIYITADKNHTNIIYRHDNHLDLFSTSPPGQLSTIIEQSTNRYKRFMNRRLIDHIDGQSLHDYPVTLRLAEKKLVVVADNNVECECVDADYIVVCRGFRGDIVDLAKTIAPNATVILSNDLNRRRRERYHSELTVESVPVVSLSTNAVSAIWSKK